MSERPNWKSPGRESEEKTRKYGLIGGVCVGLIVLVWIVMSRPSEERISTGAFNMGGGGTPAAPAFRERRSETGLSMVSRPTDESLPPAAPAPDRATGQFQTGPSQGFEAPHVDAVPEDPGKLAALGVPTDKAGLTKLANEHGLLSKLTDKVLGYPKVIRFILNNKIIVDGLFAREAGKRNCENAGALKAYMMNGADPKGVSEDLPIVAAMLKHPDSAYEAVNSEFGKRVMECPSVAAMKADPSQLVPITMANPALLGMLMDPTAMKAIAGNAQATDLMNTAQSAIGGGASK